MLFLGFVSLITVSVSHFAKNKKEVLSKKEFEPNEEFLIQRTYPNKVFDLAAYQAGLKFAHEQFSNSALNRSANTLSWQLEGPGNIGGRFNCIVSTPSNPSIMYAGSANGGLWKTTNNGSTWIPLTDGLPFQAIGAIAINPSNANEIWIGMGDVNISGTLYTGDGVYKSTDAGLTWTHIGLANTYVVSNITFNSTNTNEVLICTMGNPFFKDTNRGVYKTLNGGSSFSPVLYVNDSTGVVDMVQDPSNPSIVYASSFTRMRTDKKSITQGTETFIYKSTDFGSTWNVLSGGLPNGGLHERIGITLCKSNPAILYALYSTSNGSIPALYKSINSGATWNIVSVNTTFDTNSYGGYGWYFGKIYVDDNNPNLLYIPGIDLQYSTDGGINWSMLTPPWYNYIVHADGHYIHFKSSTNFVYCTDGGLYSTTDGGTTWNDIDYIPNNQFYSVTENPNNFGEYAGGVQDNGTMNGNATVINNFNRIYGGDGFKVQYTSNTGLVYSESQNGSIVYDDAFPSGNWQILNTDGSQNYNWFTPYFTSSFDETKLFFAGQQVMRIDGAPYGNYTIISPVLHDPASPTRVQNISTINQSKLDYQKLYAGTADGKVWNTTNYGGTWNDITPFTNLPYYVTQVMPSPNNTSIVYVTRSGYRANDNTPLVFKSINNGATWVNISGNLPPLAINDIEVLPNNENIIYVANDAGVYYTTNSGANWQRLGNNMPFVAVLDIQLNHNNTKIIAGTFGRSMYTIDITSIVTSINTSASVANNIQFTAFPNPANDMLTISSNKKINQIKLINLEGKIIVNTNKTNIDVLNISEGNYVLEASIDGRISTKKIVIKH